MLRLLLFLFILQILQIRGNESNYYRKYGKLFHRRIYFI